MHDIIHNYETPQSERREELEPTQLHRISDETMVSLIACPGITERFDLTQVPPHGKYTTKLNEQTNGYFAIREQTIFDRQGKSYQLEVQRDLDTVAISIYAFTSNNEDPTDIHKVLIIKLGLRDRQFDATPHATPPRYLQAFDNIPPDEIPNRSSFLGVVDWHYSSENDRVRAGIRAVEISVLSSDPSVNIKEPLTAKQALYEGKLWVDAEQLAAFIDDPFDYLPEGNLPPAQALNNWYKNWWQVVNRILRGKSVPLPGQTSQRAFSGYLEYVTMQSAQVLKNLGYNTLSAIPTWEYVREKFKRLGFVPDNINQHQQAEDFLQTLEAIEFNHLLRRSEHFQVSNFVNKKALIAWLAVLPFAIQKNPDFIPDLGLTALFEEGFQKVFTAVKQAVVIENNSILTYPLAPGNNLWYSLLL